MASGLNIVFPGFVYDGDESDISETDNQEKDFDFNKCITEISELIHDLSEIDKSKNVKLFDKQGVKSVGFHISKIRTFAQKQSKHLSKIPSNVKTYPKQVKCATKTFTKMSAISNVGASNTGAGYCMLIDIRELNSEAKSKILNVLGKTDDQDETENVLLQPATEEVEEAELLPSQDFPNCFQSQTLDTLLHCNICQFMTHSKPEFEHHESTHPACGFCQKRYLSAECLDLHVNEKHSGSKVTCNLCSKDIIESELEEHLVEHDRFSNFRKGLETGKRATKTKQNKVTEIYILYSKICTIVFKDIGEKKSLEYCDFVNN